MASFNANQLNASDINSGQQFVNGNAFTPQNANKIIEGILHLNENVGSGSSSGGTTVEANPSGTATSTLNKIKIANTIYSIPQGSSGSGGGSTIYKHTVYAYNGEDEYSGWFYALTNDKIVESSTEYNQLLISQINFTSVIGNVVKEYGGEVSIVELNRDGQFVFGEGYFTQEEITENVEGV